MSRIFSRTLHSSPMLFPSRFPRLQLLPTILHKSHTLHPRTLITTPIPPPTEYLSLTPIHLMETFISLIHNSPVFVEHPYYISIIFATITLRSLTTLPLAIQQRRRMKRLATVYPILKAWEQTLKRQNIPGGVSAVSKLVLSHHHIAAFMKVNLLKH